MLRTLVGVTCRADSSLARVANEARKMILKESGSIGIIGSSTVDEGGRDGCDGNGSNSSSSNDDGGVGGGGVDGAGIEYDSERNDTKETMVQSRDGDDEWVLRRFEDLVVCDRSSVDVNVDVSVDTVEGVVGNKGSRDVVSVMNGTVDEVTTRDKIREAHAKFLSS